MNIGDTVYVVRPCKAVENGFAIERLRVVAFDDKQAALWSGGQLAGAFMFKTHDEIFDTEANAQTAATSNVKIRNAIREARA